MIIETVFAVCGIIGCFFIIVGAMTRRTVMVVSGVAFLAVAICIASTLPSLVLGAIVIILIIFGIATITWGIKHDPPEEK